MSYLDANLAALRSVSTGLAERVAQTSIPEGFERIPGRDGAMTYARIVSGDARRVDWLGGTSTPQAAAETMIRSLDAGTGNGLGLSLGSGWVWKAFVRKLGSAQAVFVYEPEWGMVRMALEVADLTHELATGRLVLVAGEQAGDELSRFLSEQVGYEAPTVLHPLPTLWGDRRNALLAAGEAMVRRVVAERQALVETLARRVRVGEGRCAWLVGERYWNERPLHRVAEREHLPVLRVDDHRSGSLAGRLRFLAEVNEGRGVGRILSDAFRGPLEAVPADMAVETWVPPLVGAGFWQTGFGGSGLRTNDTVVVHGETHRAMAVNRGVPAGQVAVRAVATEAMRFGEAQPALDSGRVVFRNKVALIADLGAIDAEAVGLVLPTQQAVYAAARSILEEERFEAGAVESIVRRSLARAGVPEKLREDRAFVGTLEAAVEWVLVPSVPMLATARELVRAGVRVKLIGEWGRALAHFDVGSVEVAAFSQDEAGMEAVLSDVAVVVQMESGAGPWVVEAWRRGAVVVTREKGGFEPVEGTVRVKSSGAVNAVRKILAG